MLLEFFKPVAQYCAKLLYGGRISKVYSIAKGHRLLAQRVTIVLIVVTGVIIVIVVIQEMIAIVIAIIAITVLIVAMEMRVISVDVRKWPRRWYQPSCS